MADLKITELTANTTPALVDLLPMVDDPSGTPLTQKITVETLAGVFSQNSMARQAIINGNFDVWQRGTSLALADSTIGIAADRWQNFLSRDSGTLPTLTVSKGTLALEAISNAYNYLVLTTNGAGTSLGVNSYHRTYETIENGTRYLAGNGKKVTVSFYAKSSIASKRLGISLGQNYGSGGSPTTEEQIISQAPITLTTSWVKYTVTFTTNTLSGKTFGTANDDCLRLNFWYMWGTTVGNTYVYPSVTAETYGGSGTIDIAQVQLCAGDVALPFQPKSFNQELLDCMRYYEKSYDYSVVPATATVSAGVIVGKVASNTIQNTEGYGRVYYKVKKRNTPTPVVYPWTTPSNTGRVSASVGGGDLGASSGAVVYAGDDGFSVRNSSGGTLTTDGLAVIFHYTVDAEL